MESFTAVAASAVAAIAMIGVGVVAIAALVVIAAPLAFPVLLTFGVWLGLREDAKGRR